MSGFPPSLNLRFLLSTNPLETFTKLTLPTGETGVKKFMAGSVHLHIITFSNTAYILTSETTWNESKPPGGFDTGDYVVDMTTGKDHFLLTNSGKVYYKGQNSHYQSGSGSGVSTTYQYTDYTEIDWPNQVPYQYTDEYPVKISNGWGATQMVSNYNNLYNVGLSVNGQRGNSINSNADSYKPTWFRVHPILMEILLLVKL